MATCDEIQSRLGEWLDGELAPDPRAVVTRHLESCVPCRTAADELRSMIAPLIASPKAAAPAELWTAIERRLAPIAPESESMSWITPEARSTGAPRWYSRRQWWTFAAAACLVFLAGVGGLLWHEGWIGGQALAGTIDFRPLLEQANGDIESGIAALIRAHGGREITLEEAARTMTVRIHPPVKLPADMTLVSTHLLHMGPRHRSLAFHFHGPSGQLLLLQCPSSVRKDFGSYECLPCKENADSDHPLVVGPLKLLHRRSDNVCVCIVSTLGDNDLRDVMNAIPIDY